MAKRLRPWAHCRKCHGTGLYLKAITEEMADAAFGKILKYGDPIRGTVKMIQVKAVCECLEVVES